MFERCEDVGLLSIHYIHYTRALMTSTALAKKMHEFKRARTYLIFKYHALTLAQYANTKNKLPHAYEKHKNTPIP